MHTIVDFEKALIDATRKEAGWAVFIKNDVLCLAYGKYYIPISKLCMTLTTGDDHTVLYWTYSEDGEPMTNWKPGHLIISNTHQAIAYRGPGSVLCTKEFPETNLVIAAQLHIVCENYALCVMHDSAFKTPYVSYDHSSAKYSALVDSQIEAVLHHNC